MCLGSGCLGTSARSLFRTKGALHNERAFPQPVPPHSYDTGRIDLEVVLLVATRISAKHYEMGAVAFNEDPFPVRFFDSFARRSGYHPNTVDGGWSSVIEVRDPPSESKRGQNCKGQMSHATVAWGVYRGRRQTAASRRREPRS